MLVLAGKKLKSIAEDFQEDGTGVQHLDVSVEYIVLYSFETNYLKSGVEFQPFAKSLKTLIIDNNYFFSLEDFPEMPYLQTLSANKNNFNNLELFIEQCKVKFPSLIHLSLIKNPLCPMFVGEEEYQKYRAQVITTMPKLVNLDGAMIDPREVNPQEYLAQKEQEKKQKLGDQDEEAKGTIEYNAKYSKPGSKTVKSRSEGNRFVKNNQL